MDAGTDGRRLPRRGHFPRFDVRGDPGTTSTKRRLGEARPFARGPEERIDLEDPPQEPRPGLAPPPREVGVAEAHRRGPCGRREPGVSVRGGRLRRPGRRPPESARGVGSRHPGPRDGGTRVAPADRRAARRGRAGGARRRVGGPRGSRRLPGVRRRGVRSRQLGVRRSRIGGRLRHRPAERRRKDDPAAGARGPRRVVRGVPGGRNRASRVGRRVRRRRQTVGGLQVVPPESQRAAGRSGSASVRRSASLRVLPPRGVRHLGTLAAPRGSRLARGARGPIRPGLSPLPHGVVRPKQRVQGRRCLREIRRRPVRVLPRSGRGPCGRPVRPYARGRAPILPRVSRRGEQPELCIRGVLAARSAPLTDPKSGSASARRGMSDRADTTARSGPSWPRGSGAIPSGRTTHATSEGTPAATPEHSTARDTGRSEPVAHTYTIRTSPIREPARSHESRLPGSAPGVRRPASGLERPGGRACGADGSSS